MGELGLLDELLRVPHQELREIQPHFPNGVLHLGHFSHLPTRHFCIAPFAIRE
jgi:hypothetical protein